MMPARVKVQVCVTCLGENQQKPGAEFYQKLAGVIDAGQVDLQPVECFAVCKRPCTIMVSQGSKWKYLIGDLDMETGVGVVLDYVKIYARSSEGTPPINQRPQPIRKGTIARIPSN